MVNSLIIFRKIKFLFVGFKIQIIIIVKILIFINKLVGRDQPILNCSYVFIFKSKFPYFGIKKLSIFLFGKLEDRRINIILDRLFDYQSQGLFPTFLITSFCLFFNHYEIFHISLLKDSKALMTIWKQRLHK